MINFLFGFTVGIIVSAGVAIYAALKTDKKVKKSVGDSIDAYIIMDTYAD